VSQPVRILFAETVTNRDPAIKTKAIQFAVFRRRLLEFLLIGTSMAIGPDPPFIKARIAFRD